MQGIGTRSHDMQQETNMDNSTFTKNMIFSCYNIQFLANNI